MINVCSFGLKSLILYCLWVRNLAENTNDTPSFILIDRFILGCILNRKWYSDNLFFGFSWFGTVIRVYVQSFSVWNIFVCALVHIALCHNPTSCVCVNFRFMSPCVSCRSWATLIIGLINTFNLGITLDKTEIPYFSSVAQRRSNVLAFSLHSLVLDIVLLFLHTYWLMEELSIIAKFALLPKE